MAKPINIYSKFNKFDDYWSPKVISEMNNYQFKLVKIKGEFIKHNHSDTDEVFIVLKGSMKIEFDSEIIEINEGEMIVVPKGVDHKPTAEFECHVMLVEPKGILNTGNVKGDLTAPNDEWI